MSTLPTDEQLVIQLRAGDLDALGLLYERYKAPVYRTALAITSDPAAAEDILQDSFLRLHKYAHRFDITRPLKPWLYRITVNLACPRSGRLNSATSRVRSSRPFPRCVSASAS
jgi:RNA polymerase sigma factor (sigma-70 family)